MKENLSIIAQKLFTGFGLVQTLGFIILTAAVAGFYSSAYHSQIATVKAADACNNVCSTAISQPMCESFTGNGCAWDGATCYCGRPEPTPTPFQYCGQCTMPSDCDSGYTCNANHCCVALPPTQPTVQPTNTPQPTNPPQPTAAPTQPPSGGFTPRSADQVCSDFGGSKTSVCSADPNCGANGGTCCQKSTVNYCCYGDSSTRMDGACYAGTASGVSCSGNTITNDTSGPVTIRHFKGGAGDLTCPLSQAGGADTQLSNIPGQNTISASGCEQIEAVGFCGVCNDSQCQAPTTTPPPGPTATPTRPAVTPTPTPTSPTTTPTVTPTPTPTGPTLTPTPTPTGPTSTPTPTPTGPTQTPTPNPSCGQQCDVNNNKCPSDAPFCVNFEKDNPDRKYLCGRTQIAGNGPQCGNVTTPGCGDSCNTVSNNCPSDAPFCVDFEGDNKGPICGKQQIAGLGPQCSKPEVLGATPPPVMPKAGVATDLTFGFLEIGAVGILLRLALLFI